MNPWPRLPPAELREVELVVEWQRLGRDTVPSDGVIEHRAFRGVTDEGDAQRRGEDASAQTPAGLEAAPVAVGGDAPAQTPAGFEAASLDIGKGDKVVFKWPKPEADKCFRKANKQKLRAIAEREKLKMQKLIRPSEQGGPSR